MQKSVILIMILVLIVTIFTVVNAAPVTLNLVFTKVNVSLALIILISSLFGALILFLIGLFDSRKKAVRAKKLQSENFNLKQKIAVLEKEFEFMKQTKEEAPTPDAPSTPHEVL